MIVEDHKVEGTAREWAERWRDASRHPLGRGFTAGGLRRWLRRQLPSFDGDERLADRILQAGKKAKLWKWRRDIGAWVSTEELARAMLDELEAKRS